MGHMTSLWSHDKKLTVGLLAGPAVGQFLVAFSALADVAALCVLAQLTAGAWLLHTLVDICTCNIGVCIRYLSFLHIRRFDISLHILCTEVVSERNYYI